MDENLSDCRLAKPFFMNQRKEALTVQGFFGIACFELLALAEFAASHYWES